MLPNGGLQFRRAISIQAEGTRLLEKHAIAPSAARLCSTAVVKAMNMIITNGPSFRVVPAQYSNATRNRHNVVNTVVGQSLSITGMVSDLKYIFAHICNNRIMVRAIGTIGYLESCRLSLAMEMRNEIYLLTDNTAK
jgi:hypothetical protein